MLNRPTASAGSSASGADRALFAVGFGCLGLVVGGLVVAAAGWMSTVAGQVRNQSAVLGEMQAKLDRSDQVSQAAVAALLAQSKPGADPKAFVEELTRTRASLAEAREAAKTQEALATTAATEYRRVAAELNQSVEAAAKTAAEAHGLKDELDKQRESVQNLTADRDRWLETDSGRLTRLYSNAWYAALVGWVLASVATAWGLFHWFRAGDLAPASRLNPSGPPQAPSSDFL